LVMCNGVTVAMQLLLLRSGLAYRTEVNPQIALHAPTVAWELDRMDQVAPLVNGYGDGQYTPPGLGSGVDIFILDTGINKFSSELIGRVVRPVSWKNEAPALGTHHGTYVASVAGGKLLGVAQNATLWDIKLPRGSEPIIYVCDAIMALNWVLSHAPSRTFVVVMSWSAPYSPSINLLCDKIRQAGGVLIAAAGNEASSLKPCQNSPSSASSVLSMAAVDQLDHQASFSNYGSCVFAYAAGVDVIGASSTVNNGIVVYSGTSTSAPVTAGVAAIIIALEGFPTPDTVQQRLIDLSLKNVVKSAGANTPNRLINMAQLEKASNAEPPASSTTRKTVF
jgi:subtilisin family serine protease